MSVKTMSRVWDYSTSSGSSLLLLLALADYCNEDDICWPGLDKLHLKARISKRQVQRTLTTLEQRGEIYARSGDGRGNTSQYLVCIGLTKDQIVERLKTWFDLSKEVAEQRVSQMSPFLESEKVSSTTPFIDSSNRVKKTTSTTKKVDIQGHKGGHDYAQNADNRIEPSLDPSVDESSTHHGEAPQNANRILGEEIDSDVSFQVIDARQDTSVKRLTSSQQLPLFEGTSPIQKEPDKVNEVSKTNSKKSSARAPRPPQAADPVRDAVVECWSGRAPQKEDFVAWSGRAAKVVFGDKKSGRCDGLLAYESIRQGKAREQLDCTALAADVKAFWKAFKAQHPELDLKDCERWLERWATWRASQVKQQEVKVLDYDDSYVWPTGKANR